jgi:hypothetical protein
MARRSSLYGFPLRGGKESWASCLFEEASDRVGCHVGLLCFRCQARAVKEDCNDGNKGNHVGKGELRVFGTF